MRKIFGISTFIFSLLLMAYNFNNISFMAPQEEAMNPTIIVAGTDEHEINCDVQSTNSEYTFEVDYTDTRSTESYEMNSISFSPEIDFNNVANLGTELDFGGSDNFAPTINFFPFSFFDETTTALAIGENGLISLDPQQGGQINLRYPSANIPNSTLTRNSIFASHYDLMVDGIAGAAVYYKEIGTFPARKLVITYRNVGVFYCVDGDFRTTSVQVVLEELTNEIQIYIKDKVSACGAITNAVVGIQDKYGTLGYSPVGRNYDDGDWTAQNEAYEFVPNGERTPSISWIEGSYIQNSDDNNIIGTGEQITVNADLTNLEYTVEVRYPNYRNALGELVDLVLTDEIQVSPFYPIGVDQSVIICTSSVDLSDYNSFISLNPAQNFNITYYFDQALNNPIPNPSNFSFIGESITVYAQIVYNSDCYDIAELEIASVLGLLQIDTNDLQLNICDNVSTINAEGIENNYWLSDLDEVIFTSIPNGTINYYTSATSTTPISQINVSNGTQVWVDVLVSGNNGCRTPRIGPITINFHDIPEFVNVPTDLELVICDKDWNFTEVFDENQTWQSFLAENGLVTNNPEHTVTVYETEDDAIYSSNPMTQVTMDINDPTYNPDDNSREAHLFVKVEGENGCSSIQEFTTRIRFYGVNAIDTPIFNLCTNSATEIPIDLSCFLTEADFNNDGNFVEGMFQEIFFEDGTTSLDINDVYDISYHENNNDARAGVNPINPLQTITSDQDGVISFCVRFTLCETCTPDGDDCYTIKKVRFRVVSTQPNTDIVEVCRENNGETYVQNLSIFNLQLFDNPNNYSIEYYTSESDAENQSNELTSFSFTGNDFLWVHITSNFNFSGNSCVNNPINPCEDVYRIQFVHGALVEPIDFEPQTVNNICDNNDDGEEFFDVTIFESEIFSGAAEFTYFENLDEETLALTNEISDPTQVLFTATNGVASKVIYARLAYVDNPCFEIVRLNLTINFLPGIETENGYLCACLPNPREYATYDLTSAVDQMYPSSNFQNNNPLSNIVVSYYNFYNDAENGTNEIFNSPNYQSIRGEEEVFVRFYSTVSECYSIDTLTLKNLILPVPIPGNIDICDTNINGLYDIILSDLNPIVMPNNTDDFFYSYYWNYEDAENAQNRIIETPDSENLIDYFYEFSTFPDEIYVRVDADNGDCPSETLCAGVNVVSINTGTSININTFEFDLEPVCDTFEDTGEINNPTYNDGIASGIDLTSLETEILSQVGGSNINRILYYKNLQDLETDPYPYGENAIENPENFTNRDFFGSPIEQVFVKLETDENEYCPIYVTINLTVLNGPEIFPEEEYYVCPGGMVDIRLNIPEGINVNNYTFEWTLPDNSTLTNQYEILNSTQVGAYSVRIIDNSTNCSSPVMNFLVREISPPTILELNVYDESEIEVIASGFENLSIEYSIDGENFQNNNHFYNLDTGLYTIWVRYNYNNQMCLGEPKGTMLLEINNVITPNGDGLNDCLAFNNLFVFGESPSTLQVYDRFGKVVFVEKSNTVIEWCGKFNGRVLPTTNYWYKFTIPDGRQKSGYITLKNY